MRLFVSLCVLTLLAGCQGGSEFPLKEGNSWTYTINAGFIQTVEEVRVLRKAPVAGVQGVEVGGSMGISRLAWKDGLLVTDRTVNAGFKPPLPLLIGGKEKGDLKWHGMLIGATRTTGASAVLKQEPETRTLGGKTVKTIKATLLLRAEPHIIELVTWYLPGTGPIAQEQHSNGLLDLSLETLSGG